MTGALPHTSTMNEEEQISSRASYVNGIAESSPMTLPYHRGHIDTTTTAVSSPNKSKRGITSEHGHSIGQTEPLVKYSGASVASFFTGLFQTILAISTLGASITFSYVLSNSSQQLSTPIADPHFTVSEVQLFLSISWLLFLLALAFASLGSTVLTFFKKQWGEDWDGLHGKKGQLRVQLYAIGTSTIMGGLIIGAFALLCLVVVAYSPIVGWVALGFTGFFGLVILMAISNQVPWPRRSTTLQAVREKVMM